MWLLTEMDSLFHLPGFGGMEICNRSLYRNPITIIRYVNGPVREVYSSTPLSVIRKNNPKVVYAIDFDVTHINIMHTYITNLLCMQALTQKLFKYLAGHKTVRRLWTFTRR